MTFQARLPLRRLVFSVIALLVAGAGLGILLWENFFLSQGVGTRSTVAAPEVSLKPTPDSPQSITSTDQRPLPAPSPPKLASAAELIFVSSDGKLTPWTIKKLALTKEEQIAVQNAYSVMRKKISSAAKQNLKLDVNRTDESLGVTAYVIQAYPDEGRAILDGFAENLNSILGTERGNMALQIFPKGQLFGGFGERDLGLIFQEFTIAGERFVNVEVSESNAQTGKFVMKRAGNYAQMGWIIPDVFDVHE